MGFWLAASLSAIFIGLGKGGVPVITALSVPVLSLTISPVTAAAILLPVFVASDVFGVWAYRGHFDRRVLLIMCVTMPLGVLIGYLTVDLVSEGLVTIILGLIGGAFALSLILRRQNSGPPQVARWDKGLLWGTITGFTSFVSHSGAAPYQVYTLPLRMTKLTFAGTVAIAFAYINAVKLVPYYFLGQLGLGNLRIAAVLMIPAVIAVFVGVRIVRVLPEQLFFRIVTWTLLALSLYLIWTGLGRL